MNDDQLHSLQQARKLLIKTFGDMDTHDARSENVHEIYTLLLKAEFPLCQVKADRSWQP